MRKQIPIITALIFFTFGTPQAFAGDRELYGALIGAGSGGIVGYAVGGSPESVFVGSALGGILGVSAAHIGRGGVYIGVPPFHGSPYYRKDYRSSRYHRHFGGNIRHYDTRDCRIVKYHTYRYGHRYLVKKRICRSDGDYGHRRYYRGHGDWGRDNWRGHGDRGRGNWRNPHRW